MSTLNLDPEVCQVLETHSEIVLAVLEGTSIQDLAGNLLSQTESEEGNHHKPETEESKTNFFRKLLNKIFDSLNSDSFVNDTQVVGSDGQVVRVPALLLAAISPVFKEAGSSIDAEMQVLIVPDMNINDFRIFLRHLCSYLTDSLNPQNGNGDDIQTETKAVERVMDILCLEFRGSDDPDDPVDSFFLLDQDWTDIERTPVANRQIVQPQIQDHPAPVLPVVAKRKPVRRRSLKQKDDEPYILTEVMETFRTGTSYSLRQTIKRKRFSDLVSEPSDLDDDSEEEKIVNVGRKRGAKRKKMKISEDLDLYDDSDNYEPPAAALEEEDDEEIPEEDNFDLEPEMIDEESSIRSNFNPVAKEIHQNGQSENSKLASSNESLGLGMKKGHIRLVSIMEDDASHPAKFDQTSLLRTNGQKTCVPLILICSVCKAECRNQNELKRHAARNHPGSKLFNLSPSNPHRTCAPCVSLMKSYQKLFAENVDANLKNICFPCPHCRRRYLGNVGSLDSHLLTDHRNAAISNMDPGQEFSFNVIPRTDPRVLTCDFCEHVFPHTIALNKHLLSCSKNTSGHSAGLFCHICGKMFSQTRVLRDHIQRHGKENINLPRSFYCPECPVACVSDANLERHLEREHRNRNYDENFELHQNCERCSALYSSYLENKVTQAIPLREMVFKCPHCFMLLFANQKHPPRYLFNHINKFHSDPEINDFTLGDKDPSSFSLRSKKDGDTLKCDFCNFQSKTRANHNVHLSTCKLNSVPCRPGYMCDMCGFVTGASVQLRNHLESHNVYKTYPCNKCDYKSKSSKHLMIHFKRHHTNGRVKTKIPCTKCGLLRASGKSMKVHLKRCGTSTAKISCAKCQLEFKREEDLEAHSIVHSGKLICPIHGVPFQNEDEIRQHFNETTKGEKNSRLECCMCKKQFIHMSIFMKHFRRHLKIAAYTCEICSKSVNTFESLKQHVKNLHSTNKPIQVKSFACQFCLRVFRTKGHLTEHIQGLHNEFVSVPCPVCQKAFRTNKRMKKHLYNIHPDSDEFKTFVQYTSKFK